MILWEELLTDMYGDSKALKNNLFDAAMIDDKISEPAKEWLKSIFKP